MSHLLFLVNDFDSMHPSQSTVQLIATAAARHTVSVAEVHGLTATPRGVMASTKPWNLGSDLPQLADTPTQRVLLQDVDGVWVRTNPGRAEGPRSDWLELLSQAEARGVRIQNRPAGLMRAGTKTFLSSLPVDTVPRTWSGTDERELLHFVDQMDGMAVIKPATGTRGEGVEKIHRDMPDKTRRIRAALSQGPAVLQDYLPEAPLGDVRVHLIGGQILEVDGAPCAVRRVPQSGQWRSNVALGAAPAPGALTQAQRQTCAKVSATMVSLGLWHVGLDLVGDKIVECNVFSPGGLQDAGAFEQRDFVAAIVDAFFA